MRLILAIILSGIILTHPGMGWWGLGVIAVIGVMYWSMDDRKEGGG